MVVMPVAAPASTPVAAPASTPVAAPASTPERSRCRPVNVSQRMVRVTDVRRAVERARRMWKDHPDRETRLILQSALDIVAQSCANCAD